MARSVPEATFEIGRTRSMSFGRARSEAAARQVRLAESEGPDEVRAYALETLVEALTWVGEVEQALIPFIKLLRWWDQHPEHFDTGDQNILFWEFGWVVNDLGRTASVPVERVDKALDDMERRFALANRGMERVWNARLEWAMLRDAPDVEQIFSTWLTLPVDEEDSCQPCHESTHAAYLLYSGDIHGAVAILESSVASEVRCSKEPAAMLAQLAWCYVELDRLDDAEKLLSQVMVELEAATSLSVLTAFARLFEVLARGSLHTRAIELVGKFSPAMKTATQYIQLEALRHMVGAVRCLVDQGHGELRVNYTLEETTIGELLVLLEAQADELAALFDVRHGSDVQTKRLERRRTLPMTSRPLVFTQYATPEIQAQAHPKQAPKPRKQNSLTRAEKSSDQGQYPQAIEHYYRASEQAQEQGRLLEAGWCLAEAARLHQRNRQRQKAGKDYYQAVALLQIAGVKFEEIVPLFVAWAPDVVKVHYPFFLSLAQATYPSPAQEQYESIVNDVPPMAVNKVIVSTPMVKRFVRARSELKDALARVMMTWGTKEDKTTALELAEEAATWMDAFGYTNFAAHAWWLTARIGNEMDAPSVGEHYALAIRGLAASGLREESNCIKVGAQYAEYLTAQGKHMEAESIYQSMRNVKKLSQEDE